MLLLVCAITAQPEYSSYFTKYYLSVRRTTVMRIIEITVLLLLYVAFKGNDKNIVAQSVALRNIFTAHKLYFI